MERLKRMKDALKRPDSALLGVDVRVHLYAHFFLFALVDTQSATHFFFHFSFSFYAFLLVSPSTLRTKWLPWWNVAVICKTLKSRARFLRYRATNLRVSLHHAGLCRVNHVLTLSCVCEWLCVSVSPSQHKEVGEIDEMTAMLASAAKSTASKAPRRTGWWRLPVFNTTLLREDDGVQSDQCFDDSKLCVVRDFSAGSIRSCCCRIFTRPTRPTSAHAWSYHCHRRFQHAGTSYRLPLVTI